jgi:predicted RNase H-like HicB family nuclease
MKHNLTVYNLGCTHEEEQLFWWGIEHAWNPLKTPTKRKAKNIPILLVNETQMDAIYPPERRRFLDPETLPRWAQERSERLERGERKEIHEAEEDPLRGLRDTPHLWEEYKIVVAAGLYVSDLKSHLSALYSITPYNLLKPLESLQDRFPTHPKNPAIFLCLKRIFKWAERAGVDECFVLSKVYYHELGHALMDTGHTPYDTLWGRLIEESLANWYAFGYFRNKFPHNEWFRLLVEEQPIEYQGCWFLSSKIMLYWMQCKKDNEFINKTIEYFWKKKVKQLLFLHHLITLLRETLIKKGGALRNRLISTLLNSNFAKAIKDAIGEDIIIQVEARNVFQYDETGDSVYLGLELSLFPQKEGIAQALSGVLRNLTFTVTFILTPTQEEGKEPQSTLLIEIKPKPQAGFLLRNLREKTVEILNFNKDVLPEVESTVVNRLSELLEEAAQQVREETATGVTWIIDFAENTVPAITENEVRNAARKVLAVLETGKRLKQLIGAKEAMEFVVETLKKEGITYLSPAREDIKDALSTSRNKVIRTIQIDLALTAQGQKSYSATYSIVLEFEFDAQWNEVALQILAGASADIAKEIFLAHDVKDANEVKNAIKKALSQKEFHTRLRNSIREQLKRQGKEKEYYRWVVGEAHPRKGGKELQLSLPKLLRAAAENFVKKLMSKLAPADAVTDVRLEMGQVGNLHIAEIHASLEALAPTGEPEKFATLAVYDFKFGTATMEVTVGKNAIFFKSFSYSIYTPPPNLIFARDVDRVTLGRETVLSVENVNFTCRSEEEILDTLKEFFDKVVNAIVKNPQYADAISFIYMLKTKVISVAEVR